MTRIPVELANWIVLSYYVTDNGFYTSCLCLPPSQSAYYAGTEIDNGVCMIQHCIIDVFEEYGQFPVILFVDFNARTGDKKAKVNPQPDSIPS